MNICSKNWPSDHQRAKLAMEQGKSCWLRLRPKCQGCQEVASRQLHAALPEALLDMAPHPLWCSAGRVNLTSVQDGPQSARDDFAFSNNRLGDAFRVRAAHSGDHRLDASPTSEC